MENQFIEEKKMKFYTISIIIIFIINILILFSLYSLIGNFDEDFNYIKNNSDEKINYLQNNFNNSYEKNMNLNKKIKDYENRYKEIELLIYQISTNKEDITSNNNLLETQINNIKIENSKLELEIAQLERQIK